MGPSKVSNILRGIHKPCGLGLLLKNERNSKNLELYVTRSEDKRRPNVDYLLNYFIKGL